MAFAHRQPTWRPCVLVPKFDQFFIQKMKKKTTPLVDNFVLLMGSYFKVCIDYCNDMREKQKHLLCLNLTHQKRVTSP